MIENGLDIQTISTKRTDFQTDRVLLFGQVTEIKEKANPSHFLKFLLASRTNGTTCPDPSGFGFFQHTKPTLRKTKRAKFTHRTVTVSIKTLNLTTLSKTICLNEQRNIW